MATMRVIENRCEGDACKARATFELLDKNGKTAGKFCAACAKRALLDLAVAEGEKVQVRS